MAGFRDIIGQEVIKEHFRNAVKLNKISHAYIINGEEGTGKKAIGKAFSMLLQCENSNDEPCMECQSCRQILTDNNPDVKYLVREKNNNISVKEVREQIVSDISIRPYKNQYKIYIIEDSELMNESAQNALLKTIEEPPSYAVILLLSNNKERFLDTILSRCVIMEMRPIPTKIIEEYLMKNGIVDYRAKMAARFAGGNIGKALRLAGSEDFNLMKDKMIEIVKNGEHMTAHDMVVYIKSIHEYKEKIDEFLDLIQIWYRDVLLYKSCKEKAEIIFEDQRRLIIEQSEKLSYEGIEDIIKYLNGINSKLHLNVNYEMVMEILMIKIREGRQ